MHPFYKSIRGAAGRIYNMKKGKKGKRDGEKLRLDIISLYKSPTERERYIKRSWFTSLYFSRATHKNRF